jgi:DNA-binding NtrC family response regulator
MEPRRAILIADDEPVVQRLLEYHLKQAGYRVRTADDGQEAMALGGDDLACALVDLNMPYLNGMGVLEQFRQRWPEVPVIIISAMGEIQDAVEAMKKGAFDYVTKPFDMDALVASVTRARQMAEALGENRTLRQTLSAPASPNRPYVGRSRAALELARALEKIAPLPSSVLLTGESGVGKTMVARLLHQGSPRAGSSFVSVSCPALPRELIEAELFGHERGAFTGANQKRVGRMEMADGGTLFLDEIGDPPLSLQPKLLNVIQDREIIRLGSSQPKAVDFRLITATNLELDDKISAGEFREDLFYRLNVISLHIPALRERQEDIPDLASHLLERIAKSRGGQRHYLGAEAAQLLCAHAWPGNVRELENVLERATAFAAHEELSALDLPNLGPRRAASRRPTGLATPGPVPGAPPATAADLPLAGFSLEDLEREALLQTLQKCGGNKALAARQLGVTERSIYNKLARIAPAEAVAREPALAGQ